MKHLSFVYALTLLTAVTAAGCSDGFQAGAPDASFSDGTPADDAVVPVDVSGDAAEEPAQDPSEPSDPAEPVTPSVTAPYCYTYGFVSTRNGYETLYTTSTCSREAPVAVTRNTDDGVRFRNLQISRDGKKATYDYVYPGVSEWVMSIDDVATFGTGGSNISGCRSAALSPDNQRVAYVCGDGLYTVDQRDLGSSHLVASDDTRTFEKAVWSPVTDGADAAHDKVVFSAEGTDGSDKLYVFNAKTDLKPRYLYEHYEDGRGVVLKGRSADISRDGKTLLFVRDSAYGSREQVWACDLMFDQIVPENSFSTSAPRIPTVTRESLCVNPRVLTSEGNNTAPHFTSNGKHVFFSSDRDGNKEIYVMKADGSDETNLTQDPAADRDVAPFPVLRTFDASSVDVLSPLSVSGH